MKQSQSGFGPLAILLIVVVVSLCGLSGWRMWSLSQANKKIPTANAIPSSPTVNTHLNWKLFENKKLGIRFLYPNNWKFEDESAIATPTGAYNIGNLSSNDSSLSIGIRLMRKKDGLPIYTSIYDWKVYAKKSNIKYNSLSRCKSTYTCFSFILDVGGASAKVYKIFNSGNNVELVVMPTETSETPTVEKMVNSIQLE